MASKPTDTLNLAYHRDMYIKIALKVYPTKSQAAKALGISTKTLENNYGDYRFSGPEKRA